jgi:uncharacterized protein YjiS (DUF1127 family)
MASSAGCVEYRSLQVGCNDMQEQGSGLRVYGMRLLARYRRWQVLAKQRRELARLSDHMLKDIGLSRVDALREARRPFWDDPRNS